MKFIKFAALTMLAGLSLCAPKSSQAGWTQGALTVDSVTYNQVPTAGDPDVMGGNGGLGNPGVYASAYCMRNTNSIEPVVKAHRDFVWIGPGAPTQLYVHVPYSLYGSSSGTGSCKSSVTTIGLSAILWESQGPPNYYFSSASNFVADNYTDFTESVILKAKASDNSASCGSGCNISL